jgi:6-phosphogluconolactonase
LAAFYLLDRIPVCYSPTAILYEEEDMRRLTVRSFLGTLVVLFFLTIDARAQGNFLYTNNNVEGPNTVSAFSIGNNGALTQITGSPFLTGGNGSGVGSFTVNRILVFGERLYVVNPGSHDISLFVINPSTGALTLVSNPPTLIGDFAGNGSSLTITPNGKFLYVAGIFTNTIRIFSVGLNGLLTPLGFSPVASFGVNNVRVTPNGKYLIATEFVQEGIKVYQIAEDGNLNLIVQPAIVFGGAGATRVEFTCAGNLIFVGQHSGATTTDVLNISEAGMLSKIAGSPFIQSSGTIIGNSGQFVLLSSDQKFLFVSNQFSDTVTVWEVAPDGALTLVSGSAFPASGMKYPSMMALSRDGNYLYVANASEAHIPSNLTAFKIEPNGVLTLVSGSPFSTGQGAGLRSIAAYPARNCNPGGTGDFCIQDESTRDVLRINITTGAYQLTRCSSGFTAGGTGVLSKRGCTLTLQDSRNDRRITATIDTCQNKATAAIQIFTQGNTFTLTDRNTTNNTCSCPNSN